MALPDIKVNGLYYQDWLDSLQAFRRQNVPELSDFSPLEPISMLESMFAAIAHAQSVHIDLVAEETYVDTARLLQSLINIGALVGYKLSQASPAVADLVCALSQAIASPTALAPINSKFEPAFIFSEGDRVSFENLTAISITSALGTALDTLVTDIDTIKTDEGVGGTAFQPFGATPAVGDTLYIGHPDILFGEITINNSIAGSNITGVWEYYDEGTALWTALLNIVDGTSNFSTTTAKIITYTLPQSFTQDWGKIAVNGKDYYWIRYRITVVATPTPPTILANGVTFSGTNHVVFPITQGKVINSEVLGSSTGIGNQVFGLINGPLIDKSLTVQVDEGAGFITWTEVEDFLTSNATDIHYKVIRAFNDLVIVKFGDGVNGKIPISGTSNVRADYRIGAENDGNVGVNTIINNVDGVTFFASVTNPRQAAGWTEKEGAREETFARIRESIPATLRSRTRAISLPDFEYHAAQFTAANGTSPVLRATAINDGAGVETVEVAVSGPTGSFVSTAHKVELEAFFNDADTGIIVAGKQAVITDYVIRTFTVTAAIEGGSLTEISAALLSLLSPGGTNEDGTFKTKFGQVLPLSVLYAEIQKQTGVRRVTITTPTADLQLQPRELPLLTSSDLVLTVTT